MVSPTLRSVTDTAGIQIAGTAVEPAPRRRPALSPSRAGDFKQCPLLYRFRAIDRLPELPVWLESAAELLEVYFRLEDPRRLEPAARELLVETELASGLLLRGYIDRLDVAPTGEIRVVDYKTGAAPRPVAEVRALFQMKFYALALLQQRGVVPAQLRLLYLADGESLTYEPDEAELRRFERTLDAIWLAIRTAGETGDFRPNRTRMCDWCSHKAFCPAWDGTPPDYPGWPESAEEAAAETVLDRMD